MPSLGLGLYLGASNLNTGVLFAITLRGSVLTLRSSPITMRPTNV